MALTSNKIAVAMFGVAAGGFKPEIDAYLAAHGASATVAALLPASGLNPTFLGQQLYDNQQFAEALVARMMPGLSPTIATATAGLIVNYMAANPTLSRADVIVALIEAIDALPATDPTYGAVASSFDTKVALADAYTGNSTDLNELAQVVGNSGWNATQGQTFTLTTGVDNITGTNGNDTINGSNTTLTLGDVIDGGAGNDTLYVGTLSNTFNFNLATVTNVENLVFENASGGNMDGLGTSSTVNVGNIAGLKNVAYADKNSSAKNVTIETNANVETVSVKNAATVQVKDNAASGDKLASVTVENSGVVTVNSDALTTLSLKDTSSNANVSAASGARTLTLNVNNVTSGATITDISATKLVVNATGKASNIALTVPAATALDVAGDKAVTIALAPSSVTAITSTNTAGLTMTNILGNNQAFTGGDGKDSVKVGATTKTIDMGKGDDVVTVNVTSALGTGGALKGGDGTDTLSMSGATAASLTTTSTFANAIDGFEVLSLSQISDGQNNTINLANLDDISYVKSAGTQAGTGTSEVQTLAVGGADTDGGVITVGGVNITVPSGATATLVADAIFAQAAAIQAANPNITDIALSGSTLTITYSNTAGDVANINVVQNSSGVTFGPVTTPTPGVGEVPEQQTVQVTVAPTATGLVRINVLGTNVDFTVIAGQTLAQVAAAMAAAINAAGIANVAGASVFNDTVTIAYTGAANDAAAAVFTDLGGTGVSVSITDDATPYVAPVAEVQTVQVMTGTDTDGGEVVVNGARIALPGGLTEDQVGVAIAGALLQIQGADPNVATVAYNTATDLLTITYTAAAGDVGNAVLVDNSTSGVPFTVTEVTQGVAGAAAGQFSLTNMANGGTLELTGNINGASSVVMKDASGTSDVFNIKLNGSTHIINSAALTVAGVETINIKATDSSATADPAAPSVIKLNAAAATKLVVTGNHGIDFTGSTLTNLTELDASGVNSTLTTGAGAAAAVTFFSQVTNKNITVKTGNGDDWISLFSLTDNTKGGVVSTGAGDDVVDGSVGSDTINLGDGNDWVWSSGKADTITLGAGKDVYALWQTTHSTIAATDVITDFQANTVGQGPGGAATAAGAVASLANRNGDVIDLSWVSPLTGIQVGNFTNAADAQTYIQNGALDANAYINAALDASSGKLYLDINDDGVIDSVIQLTGVTSLTTAAFVV